MKILFVSSESAPFVKTGGLGDVAGSLPPALKEKGIDCRAILPLYRCIPQEYKDKMRYINHIYIDMGWRKQYCGVFELEHSGCTYYFVDNEYYFNGDKPYDYIHLDCEKFIFFSKAVLSLLPTLDFHPDVIHCNDWQTGAIPVFLDTFHDNPFYDGIKTIMTIHNLRFQGRWDLAGIKDVMGISDYYFTDDKLEYYKDANLLKGGLVYADKITTVSESYAEEIKTREGGEGLDGLLSARSADVKGIVNGISYDEWNPDKDANLHENYNIRNFSAKKKLNKIYLQQLLNLPADENKFMIGIISRLTDQKGFDLVDAAMERLSAGGAQIIVLGTGEERYENMFRHYAWKYPDRVSANIYFSSERSHLIYGACDAFLMPSRFEPCGLSQLISMRYGTLPIVRETGGLKDTVTPYNEYTGEGTGFSFANYSADDMMHVVDYAMNVYYNKRDAWNAIVKNAMKADFSWDISAQKYIDLYSELTGIHEEIKLPETKKEPAAKKAKTEKESEKAEKKTKKPAAKSDEKKAKTADKKAAAKTAEKPAVKTADKKETAKTKPTEKKEPAKTAKKETKKTDTKEVKKSAPAEKKTESAQKAETSKSEPIKKAEEKKTAAKAEKPQEKEPAKKTSVKEEKAEKKTTGTQKKK